MRTKPLILIATFLLSAFSFSQNSQEITFTINNVTNSDKLIHFESGEALRSQKLFREAIAEYEKVIAKGDLCGKEGEAHYNIGLCYTWLMELNNAAATFKNVVETYPDDGLAVGYALYGLSWIDVQNENYQQAIQRLENALADNISDDDELIAMMWLAIGKISGSHLRDWQKAQEYFLIVKEKYPKTKAAQHPFVVNLGNKNRGFASNTGEI